ncbi:MAG: cholesterol oxidase [Bradymonadia bacterium]|jgi:cholesterol oxidase
MKYDYIIVGSGFGGSVAAHRLTEKGYSVAVIEQGRRYTTEDMPKSNWDLRKAIWAPSLGLRGTLAITTLKDVVIFHGAGVGGGSLVYANTHLEPLDAFYTDPIWADLADWRTELAPHYEEAKRMLGSVTSPQIFETDRVLQEVLEEEGQGETFVPHTVGVFFGEQGETVPDPYFDGEGPDRTGCTFCGSCMIGCRVGAKNTLDKNYLYFAEKRGAQVIADTRVCDVRPLATDAGEALGTAGYEVVTQSRTAFGWGRKKSFFAQNVVFSAGVLGTVKLLMQCKVSGSLPNLSPALGTYVRTNSESIQGVQVPEKNISRGIAISSGGFTSEGTHIEMVRYGEFADAMAPLTTVHVGGGRLPRQLYFIAAALKRPFQFLKQFVWPFGWSRRTAIVLAMQATDTSMELRYERKWYWPFSRSLSSDWGERTPPPTFMPDVHRITQKIAEKMGGEPGSILPEVALDTTTTAHILGGCPMGADQSQGVINDRHEIYNYPGLFVADASAIPANLGVNPTLTITAMTERAMSLIPDKASA